MSNIDKQALREKFEAWAEEAGALPWGYLKKQRTASRNYSIQIYTYMWNAWIACHEELLDELEAKENRINRLEAIVYVAEQRNALMREWKRALKVPCDLVDDQVPVVIHGMVIRLERLKETEAKLEAAEKRIAELEAKLDTADELQDSAFRHGLQHGFSYGQTDDQAGFEQAIQAYGQQWKGE
ncbi:hypothetical protein [Enterobacter sp.]|uniref:hypothetical protein n=1 Tax=Enterobacter sp. TaxID=42895 RepID=UPI00290D8D62|nr:hypothetical protein [Enterobacter sp.]MDU4459437.1 hypothetical protein [Enterobacter sp.]